MPSLRVISTRAALTSNACARLSSAQGPAISTKGRSLPSVMSPMVTCRGCIYPPPLNRIPGGERLYQTRLGDRGLDERREQRVRLERARFQLGMELHPDEPGMHLFGQLDNLR